MASLISILTLLFSIMVEHHMDFFSKLTITVPQHVNGWIDTYNGYNHLSMMMYVSRDLFIIQFIINVV